jgi:hypothetical protein
MAAGDVRQGTFTRVQTDGRTTIAALIGGGTYLLLKIKAGGCILIGDATIDPAGSDTAKGYRLTPGEEFYIDDGGNTVANLIDGAKINIYAAEGARPVSISIFAIDDA